MMTVDEIKNVMDTAPLWTVRFLKKNGMERRMIATRDWTFLKENADEMQWVAPVNKANYDADLLGLVRVWDCDELGWRTIPAGERLLELTAIGAED